MKKYNNKLRDNVTPYRKGKRTRRELQPGQSAHRFVENTQQLSYHLSTKQLYGIH